MRSTTSCTKKHRWSAPSSSFTLGGNRYACSGLYGRNRGISLSASFCLCFSSEFSRTHFKPRRKRPKINPGFSRRGRPQPANTTFSAASEGMPSYESRPTASRVRFLKSYSELGLLSKKKRQKKCRDFLRLVHRGFFRRRHRDQLHARTLAFIQVQGSSLP